MAVFTFAVGLNSGFTSFSWATVVCAVMHKICTLFWFNYTRLNKCSICFYPVSKKIHI